MPNRLTFLQSGKLAITLVIMLLGLLLTACGDWATPLSVGSVVTPTSTASSVADTSQTTASSTSATVANSSFKGETFLTLPQDEVVGDLVWSPDGKTLATTTASQIGTKVRLWNTSTGKEVALANELQGVTALHWLPDGKLLTLGQVGCNVANCDKKLRLWSDQGKLIAELAYSTPYPFMDQLKPSPDNKTLAAGSGYNSADNKVWLWSLTDGKPITTLDKAGPELAWSPDSKLLATSYVTTREPDQECQAKSGGTIIFNLWNPQGTLSTKACIYSSNYPALRLAWSPDSERLAISSEEATLVNNVRTYSIVRVYSKGGQEKANFEASASFVTRLAWSPLPGKRVLALTVREGCFDCMNFNNGSDGGTLDLWYDGAKPMIAIPNAAHELAWSPDGKMLAVAFFLPTESTGRGQMEINARYVKLFNEEGKVLFTLTAHEKSITKLAWSPDGKILASASEDNTVKLWR